MRFISYGQRGFERAAFASGNGNDHVDLEAAMRAAAMTGPTSDLRQFLCRTDWRSSLQTLAHTGRSLDPLALASVRIGAPIPRPGQVLLAGVNYRSHRQEVLDDTVPKRPVVLGKMANAVVGPYDEIVRPPEIAKLDYEGEVAVVIGRTARRVPPSQVHDIIAGYTIMNDVSGRDLQLAEHETNPFFRMHFLGKSADTFAPMGPALVTADELDLGAPFAIRTWVDDELRQDGATDQLVFSIEDFISYVTTFATLHPGDVISTGTPGGVGHYMKPPSYLRGGHTVRVAISGLGEIRNAVRDEVVEQAAS